MKIIKYVKETEFETYSDFTLEASEKTLKRVKQLHNKRYPGWYHPDPLGEKQLNLILLKRLCYPFWWLVKKFIPKETKHYITKKFLLENNFIKDTNAIVPKNTEIWKLNIKVDNVFNIGLCNHNNSNSWYINIDGDGIVAGLDIEYIEELKQLFNVLKINIKL